MKRTQAKRLGVGAGGDGYPLAAVQKIGKALASDDSRIDPSRFRLSARPLWALIFATTLLLCAGISAHAEVNQDGDLIVSFDGGLSPTKLPRRALAPVAVRVAGNVKSATGNEDSLPQLRKISVAINRQGHLFDHGLPVCQVSAIQPSTEAEARAVCGGALVGSGHVTVQARLPTQLPFTIRAKLLAFNGPRRNGHKLILAQAYGRNPPGSFVLTFRLNRQGGLFGTVLSTTLPKPAQNWAYITHFDMTLRRIYTYQGARHSFVSAACTAPAGFDTALFPFAKATYGFANGQSLTTSVARSCRVRG